LGGGEVEREGLYVEVDYGGGGGYVEVKEVR